MSRGLPPTGRSPWTQRVVHQDVTVLAVREPGALDELRELVPLDDFVLAVISETQVLIDPARTGELHDLLSEAGAAPLVQRARPGIQPDPAD